MSLRNNTSQLVSIIIVNFNGKKWLKSCLDSVFVQSYQNIEVILVDNNSTDDSIELIKSNYPKVVIVENDENTGFAGGNNIGYKYAKGTFIYLLNNDTELTSDCVKNLVAAMNQNAKIGSAQSKMLLLNTPDKLDVVGAYWTFTGFLYYYGAGAPAQEPKFNKELPVYSNKGASMMLKRDAVEQTGLFDDDFWCYYEEGDLCARLWLMGYECWYVPSAIMSHAGGGTALTFNNSYIQFHNFKNKLMSFIKCHQVTTLVTVLPIYLFLNVLISIYWLIKGKFSHFLSLYKAIFWNIAHLRSTLKKRKVIQSKRVKTDKQIFSAVARSPKLTYYLHLLVGGTWVYED